MTEDDYGQYLGQNGKCHFNSSENVINIGKLRSCLQIIVGCVENF